MCDLSKVDWTKWQLVPKEMTDEIETAIWRHMTRDLAENGSTVALRAMYRAMLAAAPELVIGPGAEWRPIASAPRDGTRILVWMPWPDTPSEIVVWWSGQCWNMLGRSFARHFIGTHWQPLPPPPAAPAEEE